MSVTSTNQKLKLLCRHHFSQLKKQEQDAWYQQQAFCLLRSRWEHSLSLSCGTCSALTTLIGCSSPSAWMQCWNKQLMLSFIFISSSPSRASSLPSRYSRLTCQVKKNICACYTTADTSEKQVLALTVCHLLGRTAAPKQRTFSSCYLHEKQLLPKPRVVLTRVLCLKEKGTAMRTNKKLFRQNLIEITITSRSVGIIPLDDQLVS